MIGTDSDNEPLVHSNNAPHEIAPQTMMPVRHDVLRAFAGILPFAVWVALKLGWIGTIPYFILHLASGFVAIRFRDSLFLIRWFLAMVVTVLLSGLKTALLLTQMLDDSLAHRSLLYALTALWECSNTVLIVGGKDMLERFGITDYQRALVASLSPAQVKFVQVPVSKHWWLVRTVHISGFIITGVAFSFLFGFAIDILKAHVIAEAESLVILTACFIVIWDLPSHFWQLCLIDCPVQVIYPYGAVYFATSSRDFWSKWSRPPSSLLRHMIYYPAGGHKRPLMSIPVLFLLNARAHFDVSKALIGDRCERGWLSVFGTLGMAVVLEVFGNQYIGEEKRFWRVTRALLAHVSLNIAAYILVHECLKRNLSDFVYRM